MSKKVNRQDGVLKAKIAARRAYPTRMAAFFACLLAGCLLVAGLPASRAGAQGLSLGEEMISDPLTGAAILGFDPVAYFVARQPVLGSDEHQTIFAGKVWHFQSRANLAAFRASPATYIPAFGGYDPVAIAAGFAVAGSPEVFAIIGERIFLFRKEDARDAFLRDPAIIEAAIRNWPQVKRDLAP